MKTFREYTKIQGEKKKKERVFLSQKSQEQNNIRIEKHLEPMLEAKLCFAIAGMLY